MKPAMENRKEYDSRGHLEVLATDAGMRLENLGDDNWRLCGYRSDGSSIVIHAVGRVALVEEWPKDTRPWAARMVFGRISVEITPDDEVILTRAGLVGRGGLRTSHMWSVDQVEAAIRAAMAQHGEEAVCTQRALKWALDRLRQKASGERCD